MDVRCEKCSTEYEFDEERVGANGVTVKCTACGFVFKVRRPRKVVPPPRATTTLGKGPQGREWLVRKPDGQMIAFRELTTLQKWIVEGRIARDDEISKNGETWKRLGNILELEPFFSVYEKARALNDLIDRGGEGTPVQLRGSEVLATMNPLSSISLEGATIPPSGPSAPAKSPSVARAETVGPEFALAGGSSPTQRASSQAPMYASSSAASLGPPAPPPPSHPPANGSGRMRPESAPAHVAVPAPSLSPAPMAPLGASMPPPGESYNTGLAGPGALDAAPVAPPMPRPISRAPSRNQAWPKDTLSISIDDDEPKSDIVERFERQQKAKRVWVYALVLIVLGAGGGIALAKFGPSGNPLQVFAERYGLLQPKLQDDGASRHLEEAQRAIDHDTLASLHKAEGLLELAEKTRPNDPAIRGDRALVMIIRAEALRRAANDMTAAADEAERAKAAWQAKLKAIREKSASDPLPPEPSTSDVAALRAEGAKNGEQASALLKQAFDLAAAAYQSAPEAFEPARALSEYYRVQLDMTGYARELARAKAVIEKSGATDPTLLYGEAAALNSLSNPSEADLAKAAQLLEQALSIRPSMNRARVLLARLDLGRQKPEPARMQLDRVLQSAVDHQEARWLRDVANRQEKEQQPQAAAAAMVDGTAPPPAPVEEPKKGRDKDKDKDKENGKGSFESLMNAADRARERDRPRQALQSYEKAADLRPTSAEPLTGMGWSYIDLEKPEAALNMFRRALKVNDRYAEAYYGQAEALRMLGRKQDAIEAYKAYLSRAPSGGDRKAAQRALEQLQK